MREYGNGGSDLPSQPIGLPKQWRMLKHPGSLTAPVTTSTRKDENDDADVIKKKKRVAEIKAANKAKRKGLGKTSNVSGVGTVTPILSSYPTSGTDTAGTGFSLSDVPSVVWIVLAAAIGIFLIKSAGKR